MDVISLYNGHQHVTATQVTTFMLVISRIEI